MLKFNYMPIKYKRTNFIALFCFCDTYVNLQADVCLFWQLSYTNEYVHFCFALYIIQIYTNFALYSITIRSLLTIPYVCGWQHIQDNRTNYLFPYLVYWEAKHLKKTIPENSLSFWGSVLITVGSTALRQCSIAYLILHSLQTDRTGSYQLNATSCPKFYQS